MDLIIIQESVEEMISSIEIIDGCLNDIINDVNGLSLVSTFSNISVTTTPTDTNRFTVGGIPVEVIGPPADKRHSLVRESSAIIDHVKQLNTRWEPSGPRSQTTTLRKRGKKKKKIKSTTKHRPTTAPVVVSDPDLLEPERKPDHAYKRHRARIQWHKKAAKLVEVQQQNGVVGLRGLLQELRYRKCRGGRKRTSVVHIERPLMHTLKGCFCEPTSLIALLGAALSFEALVEDKTSHIEIRARSVLDAAGTAVQSIHLLSEMNKNDPFVNKSLGVGWRIMRALVSAVGRLTGDDSGNPNKHNRRYCIEHGGLVILVRALASDLWSSMCRKMQDTQHDNINENHLLPQWSTLSLSSSKNVYGRDRINFSGDGGDVNYSNSNGKINQYTNEKTRPSTVAVENAGKCCLFGNRTYKRSSKGRPHTTFTSEENSRRAKSVPKAPFNNKCRDVIRSREIYSIPFSKDKEGKILMKETQLHAVRLLTSWAADNTLRPLLAVGRVLEAALLVTGGRKKQLDALDNNGKGRPLTMGRPKYHGTRLQIATNQLLLSFTHSDFEAMESADRRQAINQYATEADQNLTKFLLPFNKKTSPTVPMNMNTPNLKRHYEKPGILPSSIGIKRNIFGLASDPPIPISILDMSAGPLAADGDRSNISNGHLIPVWETFRRGMLNIDVRARTRQLWREELAFRKILDDREFRLQEAIKHSRKLNLQYNERKTYMNRIQRIEYLCSPDGRMEEARRIHGLDFKSKIELYGVDSTVRKKLLGLEPAERATKPVYFPNKINTLESEPEPVLPPIALPEYFGRCADEGGRAWWENLVIKKKRPTRAELELLPYDISKDVEDLKHLQHETENLAGSSKNAVLEDSSSMGETQSLTSKVTLKNSTLQGTISETAYIKADFGTSESVNLESNFLIPVLRPSTAPTTGPPTRVHEKRPQTVGTKK